MPDSTSPIDSDAAMEAHNAAVDRYRAALEAVRAFADYGTNVDAAREAIRIVLARRDDIDNTVCWGVECPHEAKALDKSYAEHVRTEAELARLRAVEEAAKAFVAADEAWGSQAKTLEMLAALRTALARTRCDGPTCKCECHVVAMFPGGTAGREPCDKCDR